MALMISLGDLLTIVLFILGSALLVYLILVVSKLLRVIGNVDDILEKNKENIQKSLEKLPEITDNAAKITGMVKGNLDSIQHVFDDVGKISTTVKDGVETIQKDIILKVKSILDIIDVIRKFIEKRKENSKNKNKKKSTVYKYTYRPGQDKPEEVEVVSAMNDDDVPHQDYVQVDPNEEPAAEPTEEV